ncbi:MAG TPA: hypothetical protein DEF00_01695 [Candidatus Taylorbacteria bacterium]|nr:MAG: hypothetical protein UY03_C0002G0011 [Parcubacteria group bacterium GW2011_GWA2_47_64]KKU96727.1 MAG: hypothetical protein UY29_C0007G0013 [Parcubacteria group bacterium GW2011_GWC2_48_17]HBV01090.1 hypothetical protein [Candidatus Taylorbacteria bacterium]
MNLQSKLFLLVLLYAMAVATALSYYRYVVHHDYLIEGDPAMEEGAGAQGDSGGVTLSVSE